MRFFKIFSNFCALLALPSLIFPQIADVWTPLVSTYHTSAKYPPLQNGSLFSYDEILALVEELEEVEFLEDRYTAEELEVISNLLVTLTRHGTPKEDISLCLALERDIQADLCHSTPYFYGHWNHLDGFTYEYPPAEVFQCKNWFSKQCHQIKKFVKEHKTAIIIGAAVVVAVVAVVVIVSVASASAVAAAGAAAVAAGSSESDKFSVSPESEKTLSPSEPSNEALQEPKDRQEVLEELVNLATLLEEETGAVQEDIIQQCAADVAENANSSWESFTDMARRAGSRIAHTATKELDELALEMAHTKEVLREYGAPFDEEAMQKCMDGVVSSHEFIDAIFSTNYTDAYLPQEEDEDAIQLNCIGLPPPQFFGAIIGRVAAAEITGARALTIEGAELAALRARRGVGISGPMVITERIPKTLVSDTVGWKPGDPYTNRTAMGLEPKWSTVRQRYWKNQALSNPQEYRDMPGALERMERGLAPQRINTKTGKPESMELHHTPPQREGGLFDFIEVWPEEHAQLDQHRIIGGS